MTDHTLRRTERFCDNYGQMRRRFRWEYHLLHALVAYCAAERERDLDFDALDDALALIRRNAGPFSNFRSAVRLIYAGALSFEADPASAFDKVEEAYAALKKAFFPSGYLPLAAFAMERESHETGFESVARLSREVLDAMKKDHPFLTGPEDIPFAVLAACRGRSASVFSAGVESAWTVLSPALGRSNAVQTVCHCLALAGDPVEGAETLLRLWRDLKAKKHPFGRDVELIGLAALALTDGPDADPVIEIDEWLRRRPGFGNWTLGARVRRMYAALLAALPDPSGREGEHAFTVTLTLAAATVFMITRQQAAAAAVAAST